MKIALGADHAGFEMKERVKRILESRGHEVQDLGTHSTESTDYPSFAFRVAEAVRDGTVDRGVLVCDSGNGIAIAANRVEGVRATICMDPRHAELARRHNDSNVLVLGAAFLAPADLTPTVDAWLTAPFDGGRHARRLGQITEYERAHARR
ncbi:MAG TPA: ribose 5-phosphate isomerase B [Candidatus Eisenbacteria bacterium]|jgi:ribose 5-phosphate isomerase B